MLDGGTDNRHAIDASALPAQWHAPAGHEPTTRDGEARLERLMAKQHRRIRRREADETRRMRFADHVGHEADFMQPAGERQSPSVSWRAQTSRSCASIAWSM